MRNPGLVGLEGLTICKFLVHVVDPMIFGVRRYLEHKAARFFPGELYVPGQFGRHRSEIRIRHHDMAL